MENNRFCWLPKIQSSSKIIAIFKNDLEVKEVNKSDEAVIILDKTPFMLNQVVKLEIKESLILKWGNFMCQTQLK